MADTTIHIALSLSLLTLLLPLASFVISLFVPDRFSWAAGLISSLIMLSAAICAIKAFVYAYDHTNALYYEVPWFAVDGKMLSASLSLSRTSALMLMIVTSISFLVHLYSIGYMAGDRRIKRYFGMLGFFTFAMLGIVLTDNLLLLFVFWELVGFSSYLLIGHWMQRPAAAGAAKKAFLINRIGDAVFLIGLMMIWAKTGSFSLTEIFSAQQDLNWQTTAALCVFGGVIGKSAQFPLLTWLPDAMEGPTPVSALIHAATMVAAGVYLVIRTFPLFTPDSLIVISTVGMITAIIGASCALFQFDIKKILAYSTISQLGLMIMALGMGLVGPALLHLFAHAFFKACLFLAAGSVIYSLHNVQHRTRQKFDAQDIRQMGGLRKQMPVTFIAFVLGAASLAGLPFFSGFLSKEAMFASLWMSSGVFAWMMIVTMLTVSFLTVLYTFRLLWFVFLGDPRNAQLERAARAPAIMRIPTILLGIASLWFIVSWNPFSFRGWVFSGEAEYTQLMGVTLFSVFWIGLALALSFLLFRKARFERKAFFENTFYLDIIYQRSFGSLTEKSAALVQYLDRKWIDRLLHAAAYFNVTLAHIVGWFDRAIIDGLVNGTGRVASATGSVTRSFQGGKIQLYIFWAAIAIIIFLIWTLE